MTPTTRKWLVHGLAAVLVAFLWAMSAWWMMEGFPGTSFGIALAGSFLLGFGWPVFLYMTLVCSWGRK